MIKKDQEPPSNIQYSGFPKRTLEAISLAQSGLVGKIEIVQESPHGQNTIRTLIEVNPSLGIATAYINGHTETFSAVVREKEQPTASFDTPLPKGEIFIQKP